MRIRILVLLLFLSNLCIAQKFTYESYGLKNDYTGNNVMPVNTKLVVQSSEKNNFSILAYDPRDNQISMDLYITFKKIDKDKKYYTYQGNVKFGTINYDCIVVCQTVLSEFLIGTGNEDDFVFKNIYEIIIFYDLQGTRPENYSNKISVYPISNKFKELELKAKREAQEREENERINAENILLIEKQRKIDAFLADRESKYYSLQSDDFKQYKIIEDKINAFLLLKPLLNAQFTLKIKLRSSYNGKTLNSVDVIGNVTQDFRNELNNFINSLQIKNLVYFDKYDANTTADYSIDYTHKSKTIKFKYNDFGFTGLDESTDLKYLENDFLSKKYPMGTYTVENSVVNINNNIYPSNKYTSFKGLGGSSSALFSLLVPGTGNYFVNGGKGSIISKNSLPIYTTISTIGIIGSGAFCKYLSNKNYNLYHSSKKQSDMDFYYEKANSFNKYAIVLVSTGTILWISDIMWTIKQGKKNKIENNRLKNDISISSNYYNSTAFVNFKLNF